METMEKVADALGNWVYTIYSVKIPVINVSLWLLAVSLFALNMVFRFTDTITHRNQSGASMESNNNKIYRGNN